MKTDNEILVNALFNMHKNLKSTNVSDEANQQRVNSIFDNNQKILDKIVKACCSCYLEESRLADEILRICVRG